MATAALKLAGLLVLGAALFAVHHAGWLVAALGGVVALGALGGARPGALLRQVRLVLPLVALLVVAHAFVSGWAHGAAVGLRIVVLVAAAGAVTLSTPTTDLLAVLTAACRPLRALGVDPSRVGLVLALTVRLVPLIAERLAATREAQRARGVERPGPALLVPLLVGTLRLADDLADALDARGAADGP